MYIRLIALLISLSIFHSNTQAQSIINAQEIKFSPNGNYVVAIGDTSYEYLKVWDVATQNLLIDIFPYVEPNMTIYDIDWSPDSSRIVISSGDQYVRVWNVSDPNHPPGTLLAEFEVERLLSAVEWSPDGQTIVVAGDIDSPRFQFWDANTYSFIGYTAGGVSVDLMDWNPTNNIIATIYDESGLPHVPFVMPGYGSTESAYQLCPSECGLDFPRTLSWSNDGSTLAIGYIGGTIKLIDVSTGQVTSTINTGASVYSVSWSYDDQFITASNGGVVKIWSVGTGTLVETLGQSIPVDFSPTNYEIAYLDKTQVALVIEDVSYLVPTACDVITCVADSSFSAISDTTNSTPMFTWSAVSGTE